MSATLLRTTPVVRSALRAGASKRAASVAATSFVRGKATLPDLPCKSILYIHIFSIEGTLMANL